MPVHTDEELKTFEELLAQTRIPQDDPVYEAPLSGTFSIAVGEACAPKPEFIAERSYDYEIVVMVTRVAEDHYVTLWSDGERRAFAGPTTFRCEAWEKVPT